MPIWLTLMRIELATFLSIPSCRKVTLVTNRVVADQLNLAAEFFGQILPTVPVALGQAIFERNDG